MLVYDITNEKSFDNIKNWIRNIEEVKYYYYHYYMLASDCTHCYSLVLCALLSVKFLYFYIPQRAKETA